MTALPSYRGYRIRLTELFGAFRKRPRLPPPVRRGDRVGIAALSGPVSQEDLSAGLDELIRLGYQPVPASNLNSRVGLFAGSDHDRVEAFHRLAADASLRAIIFARGGHGMLRVLPRLDWGLLRRYPRAYVGYSDVTPFLLEVVRRLGLVAFHGPMVAADLARGLSDEESSNLCETLAGDIRTSVPLDGCLGEQRGEGNLMGGCLSLLAALQGTSYAPNYRGSVLFWEDVAEPEYRIDRMLTQLLLSNSLSGIRGMVVGRVDAISIEEGDSAPLVEVLSDVADRLGVPVGWGVPSGHTQPNLTIPLGMPVRLDPQAGELQFRVT